MNSHPRPVVPAPFLTPVVRLFAKALGCLFLLGGPLNAESLNYQGRVAVGSANFDGAGHFKFAIIDDGGAATFWSNDGTSTGGSQPVSAVDVAVSKGLFSVRLGDDESFANMTDIPSAAFNSSPGGRFLRIWFSDGVNGFQLLTPDQPIQRALYLAKDIRLRGTTTLDGTLVGGGADFTGVVTVGANLQANGGINAPGGITATAITGTQGVFSGNISGTNANFTGNVNATTFNGTSDQNAKESFAPVDGRKVLSRVAAMPIQTWNFKQDGGTRHIGPMAQDFFAAFDVGTDEKHIATVDADGVALAAIQGLNQLLDEKEVALAALRADMQKMQAQISALQQALKAGDGRTKAHARPVRKAAVQPAQPQEP